MPEVGLVFLYTVAIVAGILSPIIIIALIFAGIGFMNTVGLAMINKAEELKKAPPYDDVEVNLDPRTNVLTTRFIKNDVVIWQGSTTRRELEEK